MSFTSGHLLHAIVDVRKTTLAGKGSLKHMDVFMASFLIFQCFFKQ